jgi:hypothetical protein
MGLCWLPVKNAVLMLVLMGVAGVSLAAATYRWVDADGVHFSDQPHPGAEKVALPQPQTYPSAPPASGAAATRAAAAPARGPFRYESCGVEQPANDEVLFDPESVTLRAHTSPAPRPGDAVSLVLDGAPIQGAAGQLEYRIMAPERGTHSVTLVVRDPKGESVCQASTVTFHVRQASQLAPLNPNNPANRKH